MTPCKTLENVLSHMQNLYFPNFIKVFENRLNYHLLEKYGTLGVVTNKRCAHVQEK